MTLKLIFGIVAFFLVLCPTQKAGCQDVHNPTSTGSEDNSVPDPLSGRLEIPLGPECPAPDFAFVVEEPKKHVIPLQLARRLFSETVGAVMSAISPDHRLRVRLFLTLRLGQKNDYVTVRRGNPGSTIMFMRKWNDVLFAEMLARGVLGSIVSESELDDAAHLALRRARSTVHVDELRNNMTIAQTEQ